MKNLKEAQDILEKVRKEYFDYSNDRLRYASVLYSFPYKSMVEISKSSKKSLIDVLDSNKRSHMRGACLTSVGNDIGNYNEVVIGIKDEADFYTEEEIVAYLSSIEKASDSFKDKYEFIGIKNKVIYVKIKSRSTPGSYHKSNLILIYPLRCMTSLYYGPYYVRKYNKMVSDGLSESRALFLSFLLCKAPASSYIYNGGIAVYFMNNSSYVKETSQCTNLFNVLNFNESSIRKKILNTQSINNYTLKFIKNEVWDKERKKYELIKLAEISKALFLDDDFIKANDLINKYKNLSDFDIYIRGKYSLDIDKLVDFLHSIKAFNIIGGIKSITRSRVLTCYNNCFDNEDIFNSHFTISKSKNIHFKAYKTPKGYFKKVPKNILIKL